MTYTTRKEAADACRAEALAAEKYSSAAIAAAKKGECRKAWDLADTARMAARCAMQAHEDLWELAGENMTGAEFDAFEKAEIAQTDAARAERAAAAAVEKYNEAHCNPEYRYGMRMRGFSIGCQPKAGLIRREDCDNGEYYDIIVYDRPLSELEIRDYELDDLQKPQLDPALARLCEKTGTRKEGIAALMKYYTESCRWTQAAAVKHIKGMFENGTIEMIKNL